MCNPRAAPRRRWLFPLGVLAALGLALARPPLPVAIGVYVLGGLAAVLTFGFLPPRVFATRFL